MTNKELIDVLKRLPDLPVAFVHDDVICREIKKIDIVRGQKMDSININHNSEELKYIRPANTFDIILLDY